MDMPSLPTIEQYRAMTLRERQILSMELFKSAYDKNMAEMNKLTETDRLDQQ
jgi:hypothetical protein